MMPQWNEAGEIGEIMHVEAFSPTAYVPGPSFAFLERDFLELELCEISRLVLYTTGSYSALPK